MNELQSPPRFYADLTSDLHGKGLEKLRLDLLLTVFPFFFLFPEWAFYLIFSGMRNELYLFSPFLDPKKLMHLKVHILKTS